MNNINKLNTAVAEVLRIFFVNKNVNAKDIIKDAQKAKIFTGIWNKSINAPNAKLKNISENEKIACVLKSM